MGGHGGLNILPQKRWNVYNFDNREKVRKDEEEAAKEEQLKREQSRKRDAEFRLQKLRLARGIPDPSPSSSSSAVVQPTTTTTTTTTTVVETKSNHINLFEGLKFFPTLDGEIIKGGKEDEREGSNKGFKRQKLKKEEAPKVVSAEDEKYRLGYGLAGKGVKAPWYLTRPAGGDDDQIGGSSSSGKQEERKKSGKKTLEELREERLKREKREKERELALIREKNKQGRDGGSSLKENKRGSRYHHH